MRVTRPGRAVSYDPRAEDVLRCGAQEVRCAEDVKRSPATRCALRLIRDWMPPEERRELNDKAYHLTLERFNNELETAKRLGYGLEEDVRRKWHGKTGPFDKRGTFGRASRRTAWGMALERGYALLQWAQAAGGPPDCGHVASLLGVNGQGPSQGPKGVAVYFSARLEAPLEYPEEW